MPMEVQDMLTYIIVVAVVLGFVYLITGKFLDLKIERVGIEQTRAAINLLHLILTSSPGIKKDSLGEPMKLMVGSLSDLERCCSLLEYGYRMTIKNIATGDDFMSFDFESKDPISNFPLDLNSYCYQSRAMGTITTVDMPADDCRDFRFGACESAVAILDVARTPLSELSYLITLACTYQDFTNKTVPIDAADAIKIEIEGSKICFELKNGNEVCKNFYCQDSHVEPRQIPKPPESSEKDENYKELEGFVELSEHVTLDGRTVDHSRCFFARVRRDGGYVYVEFPQIE